ncbi:hypothetical protein VCR6J2_200011 [Vibrio coralliirubri]|nr:hypothetical protein VCR6J2_200011 [Vibrio coralliirubri]CDT47917.1 hypothetical protein VCR1J2_590248 [Vibrio coralliirubri]CDU02819.1 hypothetical protein VCR8J2_850226 [Vibrio coralliirubri]
MVSRFFATSHKLNRPHTTLHLFDVGSIFILRTDISLSKVMGYITKSYNLISFNTKFACLLLFMLSRLLT